MDTSRDYITKESIFARYARLTRAQRDKAMKQDLNAQASTIAGYGWFLYQDVALERCTPEERKDYAERVIKAAVAISAILEARDECDALNGGRTNEEVVPT